ncbi:hypothetical protein ERX37_07935 [Macrococcus hajekii]|uniref:Uncharacterized protein n=1 Tax=Macrococcus hajekii TaxID=198482 RepID=A0A4R6BIF6_9STAP|nr:hypothetical protein [Macrococcus hajekii]TDM01422.1 hypothetical protein ERX37_07935 [Macrococcus hajekii]GGA99843.1 hypothetical protein GCM10007190_04870 [Macrococcus hajekii]
MAKMIMSTGKVILTVSGAALLLRFISQTFAEGEDAIDTYYSNDTNSGTYQGERCFRPPFLK